MATAKKPTSNQHFFDVIDEESPDLILKVHVYTPISKPLNGVFKKGSYLVKLMDLPLSYQGVSKGKSVKKIKKIPVRLIKPSAIRGLLRHGSMKVCLKHGIEVCHSTDKIEDKSQNSLLPSGFHPLGWCDSKIRAQIKKNKSGNKTIMELLESLTKIENRCIIHQIYGSKHYQSLLSVYVKPILKMDDVPSTISEDILTRYQVVHFATENRNVLTYEGNPAQDFNEGFFSGWFEIEIDVTKLSPVQLGLILNSCRVLNKLGKGYNSGYGRLFIEKFELVNRFSACKEEWNGNEVRFNYDIKEEPQEHLMQEALIQWRQYRTQFNSLN